MKKYDVVVIGGGPGGYVAAIRAAKEGLSVALVEGRDLGGTCLNRGCIPSKTLLKHAEVLNQIKQAETFGITVSDVSFSISDMVNRKRKVVKTLNNGVKALLRQNKIDVVQGYGTVSNEKIVTVSSEKETTQIQGRYIILANGSQPFVPEIPGLSDISYHTSDTIFDMEEIPKHLVILGGGVIGVEIACIYNSLGTNVEIVEMMDRIIPGEDEDASKYLEKQLVRQSIKIRKNTKVTGFKQENDNITVQMNHDNANISISTNCVLVAAGRKPNTTGLEELSLRYDGPFVQVDQNMQTSIPGIYAIGDLIGGYQLAHAASAEGILAVEHMKGRDNKVHPIIPRCVYSFPEVASVGMSESEAKKAGYKVKVKKVDLAANGKAIAANENNGFMKIIAEEKYGEILGVVMVGAHVTEMISTGTSFMELEGTVEELDRMVFAHPTVSEALSESAAAWLGKGIHYN